MKKLYLLLSFLVIGTYMIVQVTVNGKVSSDQGEELIGVNIIQQATYNDTITDVGGNYSLNVQSNNATSLFNCTEYTDSDVDLNGQNVVNVTLSEGTNLGAIQESAPEVINCSPLLAYSLLSN